MDQPLGDKVMKDIKSDFVVQGTHRVHNWYAFAIIGIVFGLAVGIIYVANRNAKFDASKAAVFNFNDPTANGSGKGVIVEGAYSRTATAPDREGPWILATLQPGEAIKATQQNNGNIVFTGPDGQVLKLISNGEGGAFSRDGNNIVWTSTADPVSGGTPIELKTEQSMSIGLDPNNSGGIVVTPPRTSPSKPPVPVYGCFWVVNSWHPDGGQWIHSDTNCPH